ncbi:uncharacterized protein LOC115634634 [Scaptodrosophila lebanonensis]|uniref:Uncharacterized protein LOC115634634 n=1 Tax=Drosophila lebanonensis TaxID=7225 RepID=A0A6J2UJE5_DROLE|nr:uncharacterized protein LOC115634634 [Scaptodrosophila lebanonensis]
MDTNISMMNLTTFVPGDTCVYQSHMPSVSIFIIYGLIVPTLAAFGLCANFINAVVFMRPKMTPSAFTYLAALSCLDCVSCLLITFTALSRSYFYNSAKWITYDYQWQTPLFSISTGAANLILACLSCDRFIYLSHLQSGNGAPRFCRRKVARNMVGAVLVISIAVNMPYFFVFVVDKTDGICYVTNFYYTKFYQVHNWFTFTLLAVLPAIFMIIGNAAIIIAFGRWAKQGKLCQQTSNLRTTRKRYQHQMKLTVTIVIVVTLYLIGELPAHMTSRKSAMNLLFGGDREKINQDVMEHMEVICITLNALQLSMNIVVYAVINPSFIPEFFLCLRGASDAVFRLCCLTAVTRGCKKCWKERRHPLEEQCVVNSISVQQLPADEARQCGCESWSSNSACEIEAHANSTVGTFAFMHSEGKSERSDDLKKPQVFATMSSASLHLSESKPDDDLRFSSPFIIIS